MQVTSRDDVLELVRKLRADPRNQVLAQRIAANAQAFAVSYLTDDFTFRWGGFGKGWGRADALVVQVLCGLRRSTQRWAAHPRRLATLLASSLQVLANAH